MSWQMQVVAGPDKGKTFTLQPGTDMMVGRGEKSFSQEKLEVSFGQAASPYHPCQRSQAGNFRG